MRRLLMTIGVAGLGFTVSAQSSRTFASERDLALPHARTGSPAHVKVKAVPPPLPPDLPMKASPVHALILPKPRVNTVYWSNQPSLSASQYITGLYVAGSPVGPWTMIYATPYVGQGQFQDTNPPSPRWYRAFNRVR